MQNICTHNTQSGFTLLELMIVIVIGGILAAVALPSYQKLVKDNCLTTSANNLVTSFQQARSEAIKRRSTVTLASTSGTQLWQRGWRITIDEDRNGNGVLDTSEDYDGNGVLDASALIRDVQLGCTPTIRAPRTNYSYLRTGFIGSSAIFTLCDDRSGETGRRVTVQITGRPNTIDYVCT